MSSRADELVRTYVLAELRKAVVEQYRGIEPTDDDECHLAICPKVRVNDPEIVSGFCGWGTCEFDVLSAWLSCPHLAETYEFRVDKPMGEVIKALADLDDRP